MAFLSRSEEQFICFGCQDDCRMDGRRCLETRSYVIVTEKGYISSTPATAPADQETSAHGEPPFILSNGSARLTTLDMQETILCSVKAQVVRPSVNRPDCGVVEISVDKLSAGNPSELDEIQALLSHLLLQDDAVLVNRKKLCIMPHEYVWKLSIDLVYLTAVSSATCRLHATSQVIQAALESTLLPVVATQDNSNPNALSGSNSSNNPQQYSLIVQDDIQLAQPVLTADAPKVVLVSVALIPCSSQQQQSIVMIVDATSQEQACAVGQVHVAIQVHRGAGKRSDDHIRICAVQALGKIPLSSLPEIMDTAVQVVKRNYENQQPYKRATGSYSLLQEPFGQQ
jgi:exosome complex RNA-binding protein Rrp42 (RNase PH superfamily)